MDTICFKSLFLHSNSTYEVNIILRMFSLVGIAMLLLLTSLKSTRLDPRDIIGAWQYGPATDRTVMIATDRVFTVAKYNIPGKKLISSYGGTWRMDGNKLLQKIEWNSVDTSQVGKEISLAIQLEKGKLIVKEKSESWSRADNGKPGELAGAWIISGNYINDKVTKRASPLFPRRTMKILSGTRFQWIAYNVKTRQFINAGGGSYTADNGKYTEMIEFFTKTPESVGKALSFQYSFVDGDWRHKGEKSTGGALDECWSRRETLE
ncbi:hypothetical protein WG906_08095 [Pedobacter sp. P351]|uniref:hypothetical protein n=1 Tax=Pedobacter superstes TaxID=3133441 RepID=UPI0030AC329F